MPTPPMSDGDGARDDFTNPGPTPMPDGARRPCGRHSECRCAAALPTAAQDAAKITDLQALLAKPDFSGEQIDGGAAGVAEFLPLLDETVAITVSGPAVMNDVGHYDVPTEAGGPIRTSKNRISLRLNMTRLDSAVATDPDQYLPPTLRLFDTGGHASHATYLTPRSDRLAFEALRSITSGSAPKGLAEPAFAEHVLPVTALTAAGLPAAGLPAAVETWFEADQIQLFDSILADGGLSRQAALPSLTSLGNRRIDPTHVAGALAHLAYLELPMTMVVAGAGCMQIHHDHLIAARMNGGNLTLASGMCRMMVDLDHVTECWATVTAGVWGPTASIEFYDRRGHCPVLFTQTGATDAVVAGVWDEIVASL